MNSFRLCVGVFLILAILISITSISGTAAELKPPSASLGDIVTSGSVYVGDSRASSGKVMDGDRISTDTQSSATMTLLDGNEFRISDKSIVDVQRSSDQKVSVRLSSGDVSFETTNNRVAIAIGEYQIVPEKKSIGHVTLLDAKHASIHLKSGRVRLLRPAQPAVVISGKSERVLALVAATLPAPDSQPSSQDPATSEKPPAEIVSMSPPDARPGDNVTVNLVGRNTTFDGSTKVTVSGKGASVRAVNVSDETHLDFKLILKGNIAPGPQTITVTTGAESITRTFDVRAVSPGLVDNGPSKWPIILGAAAEPLLSPNMHRSTETGTNAHPIVQELRRQLCLTEPWEGNTPQNSRAPVARLRIPGQQTLCPAGFAWIPRVERLAECLPLRDPPA
jgi:hypothetical protein